MILSIALPYMLTGGLCMIGYLFAFGYLWLDGSPVNMGMKASEYERVLN
jgi:hypothetical protein